jgi:hypothetical protein
MNREEYKDYEKRVNKFFEREGINNLSIAVSEDSEDSICPGCNNERDFESHFSHINCECCSRSLGGDRYHCTGYNPETKDIYCYDICIDCYYYAEYGQLDDMTMLEIEEN